MSNILDTILSEVQELKQRMIVAPQPSAPIPAEIINGEELCKRLDISEPTLIKWRIKKKIPFIKLDSVIRYNWPAVIEALESKNNAK